MREFRRSVLVEPLHIALEAYEPDFHHSLISEWSTKTSDVSSKSSHIASILDDKAKPSMTHDELKSIEGGLLLLSANSVKGL